MTLLDRLRKLLFKKEVRTEYIAGISVSGKLNDTETDEKGTVRRWLEHNHITYSEADLIKDPQNSDIDIIVGEWKFQITKLPGNDFLRSLNTTGSADSGNIRGEQFVELIKRSVKKKEGKYYPPRRRMEMTVLIDGHPLEFPASILSDADKKELRALGMASGFKEVWFVGVGSDFIFNLNTLN